MKVNNSVRGSIKHVFIKPNYSKFSRVPVERDGVLLTGNQFVEYSACEKVNSSEFSLGNLIAIGATSTLQYVSMSTTSEMNFVDSFASSYSSIKESQNVSQAN